MTALKISKFNTNTNQNRPSLLYLSNQCIKIFFLVKQTEFYKIKFQTKQKISLKISQDRLLLKIVQLSSLFIANNSCLCKQTVFDLVVRSNGLINHLQEYDHKHSTSVIEGGGQPKWSSFTTRIADILKGQNQNFLKALHVIIQLQYFPST